MDAPVITSLIALAVVIVTFLWRRLRPKRATRRPRNHVYVIAHRDRRGKPVGPSKIGIAKDPEQRLRTFQTANPRPLVLYRTFRVSRARALEQAVHKTLHAHRMKGEWFALPPHSAAKAVRAVIRRPNRGFFPPWRWLTIR